LKNACAIAVADLREWLSLMAREYVLLTPLRGLQAPRFGVVSTPAVHGRKMDYRTLIDRRMLLMR
jgi:hypothetical protein